ncbi:MAG: cobalamin-binding protein [Actinomycetota bacterium]|nr:cobalamin-binding protein [Actinomycetota bacterium]
MRIASLVPSATEALFALGLGTDVVAVTHECDWPAEARRLPRLTSSVIEAGLPPADVDRQVRDLTARGEAIYTLDARALERVRPDLIVTQELCAVCAVSYDDVRRVASRLPSAPAVLSLDPQNLAEVLADIPRLARACDAAEHGYSLLHRLRERLASVAGLVGDAQARPRTLALEWMDPPYVGGHWVPDMIELAGGEDVIGISGAKSRVPTAQELAATRPDLVVAMPCGLDAGEAAAQARANPDIIRRLGAGSAFAVDAAASFSRPGPRLVDGVELLAHLLHPDLAPAPRGLDWVPLPDLATSAPRRAGHSGERRP